MFVVVTQYEDETEVFGPWLAESDAVAWAAEWDRQNPDAFLMAHAVPLIGV